MARIADIVELFSKATLGLRRPRKATVAVLSGAGRETLDRVGVTDRNAETIELCYDGCVSWTVHLHPEVIFHAIVATIRSLWKERDLGFVRRLYLGYLSGVIRTIHPNVIIASKGCFTMEFSKLANIHEEIIFIGILVAQVHPRHLDLFCDSPAEYYVFGQFDKIQFKEIGHRLDNIHTTGPLIGGYYAGEFVKQPPRLKYDVCLVSQLVDFMFEDWKGIPIRMVALKTQEMLAKYLARFQKETGISICVALRPQARLRSGRTYEESFFKEIFEDCSRIDIVKNSIEKFSTYEAMYSSRLIISHYSTTAFEALSWGKKVIFFQPLDYPKFKLPNEVEWKITEGDYNTFAQRLSHLLDLDAESYRNESRVCRNYFASSGATHIMVRNRVEVLTRLSGI